MKLVLRATTAALLAPALMALLITRAAAQTPAPRPVAAPPADWRQPVVPCEDLARAALPQAKIEFAESHSAGSFQPPPGKNPFTGADMTTPPLSVPAFCRIGASLSPTPDSNIEIEVWLPAQGWNQKFMGIGNGGFAGSILYPDLASGIRAGYAAVSTDSGHKGGNPKAFDHAAPAVTTDYGWRAAHEMTVAGKKLASDYYGTDPKFSYFTGCSGGGRMGLIEAQRFPADYDGVVAGSAAISYARVTGENLWVTRTNLPNGTPVLGAAQFALLKTAAIEQCDANDGVKDGEIADPRACDFKPRKLLCKAGQSGAECLTPEQVSVAEKLYAGIHNPRGGALLWAGMVPGSEAAYTQMALAPFSLAEDFYRYMVFANHDWNYQELDFSRDVEHAEQLTADIIVQPDLREFGRHGGKLIQYASWNENTPPPEDTINYYESAAAKAGSLEKESRFHKLYVIPNGSHCSGGYSTPWFTALESWVESGTAPNDLLANRLGPPTPPPPGAPPGPPAPGPVIGTRPMCAYPTVSHYKGSGDINSAENFRCVAAPRGARKGQSVLPLAPAK